MPASILVVVVSYRNNAQLLDFLTQNAGRFAPRDYKVSVIAVANGLKAPEQQQLHNAAHAFVSDSVALLASEENPGYFGGAAKGLAAHLATHPPPDWVIVTNDDIYFADVFFAKLAVLSCPPDTGVIAPDTVVPSTGNHQNPYQLRRPGRMRLRVLLLSFSHPLLYRMALLFAKLRPSRWFPSPPPAALDQPCDIYAPHGACVLFHARYFAAGGTLDHIAFLYAEENFVAEICRRAKLRVRYEPSLRVEHHEHSTMRKVPSNLHLKYMRDATIALWQHFYRDHK